MHMIRHTPDYKYLRFQVFQYAPHIAMQTRLPFLLNRSLTMLGRPDNVESRGKVRHKRSSDTMKTFDGPRRAFVCQLPICQWNTNVSALRASTNVGDPFRGLRPR